MIFSNFVIFQANSPQQLKKFYEKSKSVSPKWVAKWQANNISILCISWSSTSVCACLFVRYNLITVLVEYHIYFMLYQYWVLFYPRIVNNCFLLPQYTSWYFKPLERPTYWIIKKESSWQAGFWWIVFISLFNLLRSLLKNTKIEGELFEVDWGWCCLI